MRRNNTRKPSVDNSDDFDARMMNRAVKLARRGAGLVEPNPMVGCVIARAGRVLGEGCHARFGGPHAEVAALRACVASPRGATVYVTLEPCSHHGKTPPCVDALIDAGIERVVAAVKDPNPAVYGAGFGRLRQAGIEVRVGLLKNEACATLAPYLTRTCLKRPYIIAKWAQSLDGKLTAPPGSPRWISCETSRRHVHRLRARVDAVIVGSGTVAADDPMLTARGVRIRRTAARIVLDGRLRISERCQLVATAHDTRTLVVTTPARASTPKAKRLIRKGVEVMPCPLKNKRLSLSECMAALAKRGMTNVLVEGGPTLLTALFDAGLVDEALVFGAPMFIGGRDAPSLFQNRGTRRPPTPPSPIAVETRRSGVDTLYRLRFTDPHDLAGCRTYWRAFFGDPC